MSDKPLYCYTYSEETGIISKRVIEEYKVDIHKYTDKKTYYFPKYLLFPDKFTQSHKATQDVPEARLDRFVGNRFFTFDLSEADAKKAIVQAMIDKRDEAYADYIKKSQRLAFLLERNPKYASMATQEENN